MLVLSQRREDRIIITHNGETLVLTCVEIRGNKSRVGFDGPKSFRVIREKALEKARAAL